MYCIVPLAGPDFFNKKYGIKPLIPYKESTLLEDILGSRSWYKDIDEFVFVLQDTPHAQTFVNYIQDRIKNSNVVKLSRGTKGALLTSMAAASLIQDFSKPIVLDLADIKYDSSALHPLELFRDHEIEGIIPYFTSSDPVYSYLITDRNDMLLKSAEKKVISMKASGGTYFFKNIVSFISALGGTLRFESRYSVNNSLFVCPVFNELVRQHKKVLTVQVDLIQSMSKTPKGME